MHVRFFRALCKAAPNAEKAFGTAFFLAATGLIKGINVVGRRLAAAVKQMVWPPAKRREITPALH